MQFRSHILVRALLLACVGGAGFSTLAHDSGDVLLRFGAARVSPNSDSSNVLSATDGVEVEAANGFAFTGTWMPSSNWGVELLASLPFEHDIEGDGSLNGISIGSTKHLPPTLSLQYYPDWWGDSVTPYVGVGVNYTRFFDEDVDSDLTTALGTNDVSIDLDDSFGLAGQVGIDWKLNDTWSLNTALWYAQIDTEANVKVNGVTATKVDVDIDPWVVMLGFTWKF